MTTKKKPQKVSRAELAGEVFEALTLTPAQQKEADIQLAAARKKTQAEMTESTRISLNIFQLKFQLEEYFTLNEFNPKLNFGHFLKEYVSRLNIRRKTFAADISIDETLLSQLINKHRLPPDYIAIRLEIHSSEMIPATYWYKLVEMEKEQHIRTNKALRKKEQKFVRNRVIVHQRPSAAKKRA